MTEIIAPERLQEPECVPEESVAARMLANYFQGSGMSLQEYFQFPEMQKIRNPVHEYFRIGAGGNGGDGAENKRAAKNRKDGDWIQEGTLAIEECEDGWLILGAEHKELAKIAVARGRNPHYYARAWDGTYIGPLLRTTTAIARAGAGLTLGLANLTGSMLYSAASMVYNPGPRVPPPDVPWADRFVEECVAVEGSTWYFRVWIPQDIAAVKAEQKGLPVFTLLHGFKECGWDNWWQTNCGLGLLLQRGRWAGWFPGIVVLPQLPRRPWEEQWWQHWRSPQMQNIVIACVEAAIRKYGGDRKRLYLIGESLGAEGAWFLAASKPNYFAAVAASCGSVLPYDWVNWAWADELGDEYDQLAEGVGRATPFWLSHGEQDDFVPYEQSKKFAQALQKKRNERRSLLRTGQKDGEVVLKLYDDLDHHCWDHAYQQDGMIQWMLSQKKAQ